MLDSYLEDFCLNEGKYLLANTLENLSTPAKKSPIFRKTTNKESVCIMYKSVVEIYFMLTNDQFKYN